MDRASVLRTILPLLLAPSFGAGCSGDQDDPGSEYHSGGTTGLGGSGASTGGSGGTAGTAAGSGGLSAGGTSAGAGGTVAAGSGAGGYGGTLAAGAGGTAGIGGTGGGAGSGGAAGTGVCVDVEPPDPPPEMPETIDITWEEMTGELSGTTGARGAQRAIQNYPSWALDHVMWSGGSLNFCVRWDSNEPVSATLRDQVTDALERGVNAWFSALNGYDCFPYESVEVNVTGWATKNRSTFQWEDDDLVPLFINQLSEGAPDCPDACSRNVHQNADYEFPNCEGGFDGRFDQEVWLTEDYDSPNGWDFGQHVDRQGFTDRVTGSLYHIWLHEFGHGIGFPDYYDWSSWAPGVDAPKCVMNAGAAIVVTEWDQWMFRRTWSELKASGRWD